ncbi:hypothetical protein SK128_000306 [Halocaridina rubra]|uniref:mRNA export factor GLE1 n=1 Tax=Halocaridina rubra TaxID=373956 RepID=A0AAN9A4P0_HALRR
MSEDDPVDLENILFALKNSEKLKHWNKPPKEDDLNNSEFSDYNRNGLTDPGDLSLISFTEEFAFGESSSSDNSNESDGDEENQNEERQGADDVIFDGTSSPDWMDPAEEICEEEDDYPLYIAGRARHQNLLIRRVEEMSIEDEYKRLYEQSAIKHYLEYRDRLQQIKDKHSDDLEKYFKERDERLMQEEIQLRKQEEEANKTVKEREHEYMQFVRQRSVELSKLAEDAKRIEAEQRNMVHLLLNEINASKSMYIEKHEQMKQLIRDLDGEQKLEPSVEARLENAIKEVDEAIETASKDNWMKEKLLEIKKTFGMNITYVEGIIQALNVRREEKLQLEAERANQQMQKAKQEQIATKQKAEEEAQRAVAAAAAKQEEQTQPDIGDASSVEHQMAALLTVNRNKLEEIKRKVEEVLDAQNAVDNEKKMEIGRLIAIINQLHGTDQNVNRERLQKLLNFLAGRKVHHNNKIYCTNNDPILTAYIKVRLMSHIVKVGHDTQAKAETSIAAYVWLIVNLISVYPDLWEVFLYYIYTTCPYLVPLYIFQEDGQSDEDYLKARGMRQKEKSDGYYSRMGNASLLFALVIAYMKRRNIMTVQAPSIGWKLLAGLLTFHPTPGVTAIVLEQFLCGVGSDLQQTYGKQFIKLMNYAINVYVPKIEEVTVPGTGGQPTLNQLKLLLGEFKRTLKFKPYEYLDKFR